MNMNTNTNTEKNIIKHIVISGGGTVIFKSLGALQELEKNNFWKIENIKSIYGTSSGAIMGVLLCLKYSNWEIINDYLIKRPWHDVFKLNLDNLIDSYTNRGLFDNNAFITIFKPLFDVKDLSINITLKEFYEHTNIELHLFSFELNNFETVDISYLTHPDLELMTAVQMSAALPMIISPVIIDNKCYIDGGVIVNYPLSYCIDKYKNIEEILALKNSYVEIEAPNSELNCKNNNVTNNSSIIDYGLNLLSKFILYHNTEDKQEKIKNEIVYNVKSMNVNNLNEALYNSNIRKSLFEEGIKAASDFLYREKNSVS